VRLRLRLTCVVWGSAADTCIICICGLTAAEVGCGLTALVRVCMCGTDRANTHTNTSFVIFCCRFATEFSSFCTSKERGEKGAEKAKGRR
jgi:hypothetical protein